MLKSLESKKINYSKRAIIGLILSVIACPLIYGLLLGLDVGSPNEINKIENEYAYNASLILDVVAIFFLVGGLNDIKKNKKPGLLLTGVGIALAIINILITTMMLFGNTIS